MSKSGSAQTKLAGTGGCDQQPGEELPAKHAISERGDSEWKPVHDEGLREPAGLILVGPRHALQVPLMTLGDAKQQCAHDSRTCPCKTI